MCIKSTRLDGSHHSSTIVLERSDSFNYIDESSFSQCGTEHSGIGDQAITGQSNGICRYICSNSSDSKSNPTCAILTDSHNVNISFSSFKGNTGNDVCLWFGSALHTFDNLYYLNICENQISDVLVLVNGDVNFENCNIIHNECENTIEQEQANSFKVQIMNCHIDELKMNFDTASPINTIDHEIPYFQCEFIKIKYENEATDEDNVYLMFDVFIPIFMASPYE